MRRLKSHPYKSMTKYPGLRPNDEALWDQLLIEQPGLFDEVWYNVKLGDPVAIEDQRRTMKAVGMYDVSCWVVDIIARKGDVLYVIEAKPDAKAGALGQALAYSKLLPLEYNVEYRIVPTVLTSDPSPITDSAATLLGVFILRV